MKNKIVISNSNVQTKLPIPSTIMYVTALHYWKAPEWLWGIFIFVMSIFWIYAIIALFIEEKVDIFENKINSENSIYDNMPKSNIFQDRMDFAMSQRNKI